jgi:hypothetical protein
MDALAAKYAGRIAFVLVYGPEAHPGMGPLPQGYRGYHPPLDRDAATYSERLQTAQTFQDVLGVHRRILVDEWDLKCLRDRTLAGIGLFNPVVIVGQDGRIVYAAQWLDVRSLDEFLEMYSTDRGQILPSDMEVLP